MIIVAWFALLPVCMLVALKLARETANFQRIALLSVSGLIGMGLVAAAMPNSLPPADWTFVTNLILVGFGAFVAFQIAFGGSKHVLAVTSALMSMVWVMLGIVGGQYFQ